MVRETLPVQTRQRGFYEVTAAVQGLVGGSGVVSGLCNVFIHHTSASLIICENADPDVLTDLERYFQRLVPDGDSLFEHTAEGPDDMPAHVRSVLTQSALTIPVARGQCELGTWQGIFLWEHRFAAHRRRVTVTVMGEAA